MRFTIAAATLLLAPLSTFAYNHYNLNFGTCAIPCFEPLYKESNCHVLERSCLCPQRQNSTSTSSATSPSTSSVASKDPTVSFYTCLNTHCGTSITEVKTKVDTWCMTTSPRHAILNVIPDTWSNNNPWYQILDFCIVATHGIIACFYRIWQNFKNLFSSFNIVNVNVSERACERCTWLWVFCLLTHVFACVLCRWVIVLGSENKKLRKEIEVLNMGGKGGVSYNYLVDGGEEKGRREILEV